MYSHAKACGVSRAGCLNRSYRMYVVVDAKAVVNIKCVVKKYGQFIRLKIYTFFSDSKV
jgi:hypothetical protein